MKIRYLIVRKPEDKNLGVKMPEVKKPIASFRSRLKKQSHKKYLKMYYKCIGL